MVKSSICDYLTAIGIYWKRNQVGAFKASSGGRDRFIRFGNKGEADLTAYIPCPKAPGAFYILHVECKAGVNKQSDWQKAEQHSVEALGHHYITAYSIDDVTLKLRELGAIRALGATR